MLRRTVFNALAAPTTPLRMSVFMKQLELTNPLTESDRPVGSFKDEFLKPEKSKAMENKYGQYAKYSNPELAKVDVTNEVVLNTYPEGTPQGMMQATGQHDLKTYHAGFWSEEFFRKKILVPKVEEANEDRSRVIEYALNAVLIGWTTLAVRYMIAPLWWLGNPRLTMVFESNIEAEIGQLEPKECKTVVWRGKPVYIYRRSELQMHAVNETKMSELKHPETDVARFPNNREMAVVIAICTHLGCIPLPNEGMFSGFFCPCHGSHYDPSGRIRQGPAPLNLEVPPHKWLSDEVVYLGK